MRNALTFDVEEYFQVEAFRRIVRPDDWDRYPTRVVTNTRRILDLLDARNVTATFLVLGWIADRHPDLVREIHDRGHEVGCHGYAHRPIDGMSRAEFHADVRRAKSTIEDAIGTRITGYRAPTFSIVRKALWALDVLAQEGFEYDSSVFPIRHDRYGIPDAPRFPHRVALAAGGDIIEFPITTIRVIGQNFPLCGGGYFRLVPYPLIRAGLRHVNERERQPAMVYLHPWEVDPEQPPVAVGPLSRFRHYTNLSSTTSKLARLLDDFAFGAARDVLSEQGVVEIQR